MRIKKISGARIFSSPHISRAQHLAPAKTRTQVVQLGAQYTDHWTTGQSHGIGVPVVQLTTHVKSSTLYGHTVVQPNFFGLMGYYYFVYLWGYDPTTNSQHYCDSWEM